MFPGSRYLAYSGFLKKELSTICPVHGVARVMSSPFPFEVSDPGKVRVSDKTLLNHPSETPLSDGSRANCQFPARSILFSIFLLHENRVISRNILKNPMYFIVYMTC